MQHSVVYVQYCCIVYPGSCNRTSSRAQRQCHQQMKPTSKQANLEAGQLQPERPWLASPATTKHPNKTQTESKTLQRAGLGPQGQVGFQATAHPRTSHPRASHPKPIQSQAIPSHSVCLFLLPPSPVEGSQSGTPSLSSAGMWANLAQILFWHHHHSILLRTRLRLPLNRRPFTISGNSHAPPSKRPSQGPHCHSFTIPIPQTIARPKVPKRPSSAT